MRKAYDSLGNEIDILQAKKSIQYYCPICRQKVYQKRQGRKGTPIFSHYPASSRTGYTICSDGWHYDPSEWRSDWMLRFPSECRERVVENGARRHFADVLVGNCVVEFQKDALSIEEFRERNAFFTACGLSVAWVFDLSEYVEKGEIEGDEFTGSKYHWRLPAKMFRQIDLQHEQARIFVQLSACDNDWVRSISGVTCTRGFQYFYIGQRDQCTIQEFVDRILTSRRPNAPKAAAPGNINSTAAKKQEPGRKPWEGRRQPQKAQPGIDVELMRKRGGRTIPELWSEEYSGIQVLNIFSGDMMVINGNNGKIFRRPVGNTSRIIGKYLKPTEGGLVPSSSQYYIVAKADLPIWTLIRAFPLRNQTPEKPGKD